MFPYRPKIIEKAMAWPLVAPLAAGAVDCQVVPLLVSTFPAVLGATNKGADVPLPRMTLFAVRVVAPVPPLPTGSVPVTPVVSGRPVRLVATPDVGVPNSGVTNVGLVLNTTDPVPVDVVTPVPPFATGKVPFTPTVKDTVFFSQRFVALFQTIV